MAEFTGFSPATADGTLMGCGKTPRQAESLSHRHSQTKYPEWLRRRFRLRIGHTETYGYMRIAADAQLEKLLG